MNTNSATGTATLTPPSTPPSATTSPRMLKMSSAWYGDRAWFATWMMGDSLVRLSPAPGFPA